MFLEKRDQYYSKLKEKIEDMVRVNNSKKVVIIAHSLGRHLSPPYSQSCSYSHCFITGTRCTHYFLRFAEKYCGRQWISNHIHTWIAVGPLFLGAPKSVRAVTSGERMGLDAFLFENEGILLTRRCGKKSIFFFVS